MNLADFKFSRPFEVRWRDLDELQHVNNSVFMTYFEEGRTYYLNQVNGGVWDWKGRDSLILAHASVDFMAPLFYGDQPIMHVRCGRIGSKSFDLEYLITVERDGKPAKIAESKSIMVFFDYEDQASKAVPDEIRRKFSEFEGREL